MPKHYFDNDRIQALVLYYYSKPEEWRQSVEAQRIMKEIYTNCRDVVKAVLFTHKFHKRPHDLSVEELISVGMSMVIPTLHKFNPKAKKRSGAKSDLFTYISITAKNAMNWRCIKEFKWYNKVSFNVSKEDIEQTMNSQSDYLFIPDERSREKMERFIYRKLSDSKRTRYRPYITAFLNFYYMNPDETNPTTVQMHKHIRRELDMPTYDQARKEGIKISRADDRIYHSVITRDIFKTVRKHRKYLLELADYC